MEFKKLEIKEEGNWFKRLVLSSRFKKTILYIFIGATIGFGISYFSEGRNLSQLASKNLLSNVITGALIGLFVTNSPCARNKC